MNTVIEVRDLHKTYKPKRGCTVECLVCGAAHQLNRRLDSLRYGHHRESSQPLDPPNQRLA